jgi:thiol-disulfide isomerase/thioredoxin
MIFLHIDPTTKNTKEYDKYVTQGKQIFVLIYLEGCGPCNATRPEWKKIKNILSSKYKKNDDIVIADIDQIRMKELKKFNKEPKGFPSMFFISDRGQTIEDYEDANISRKDRTIDSFIEWIETKMKSSNKKNHHKSKKGGKWSLKYKRSINCNRPRGFSQKQHCKYGRKKMAHNKTHKNRRKT